MGDACLLTKTVMADKTFMIDGCSITGDRGRLESSASCGYAGSSVLNCQAAALR